MKSSYNKIDIEYNELIKVITQISDPKKIVEIGILEGYSLESFVNSCNKDTTIYAFDLFDEFNGNHSNKKDIEEKFKKNPNIKISYGDFYNLHKSLNNVDILHIDIANNGDVFEFVMENYLKVLSSNGIIIFEGGSIERDNVEWMNKYNKPKIFPVLKKYIEKGYNIKTYGSFPSITVIKL